MGSGVRIFILSYNGVMSKISKSSVIISLVSVEQGLMRMLVVSLAFSQECNQNSIHQKTNNPIMCLFF